MAFRGGSFRVCPTFRGPFTVLAGSAALRRGGVIPVVDGEGAATAYANASTALSLIPRNPRRVL